MHTKVNQWTSNVVEGCLKRLAGLQKPFKYVVTCNFVQKAGAGMHTAIFQDGLFQTYSLKELVERDSAARLGRRGQAGGAATSA